MQLNKVFKGLLDIKEDLNYQPCEVKEAEEGSSNLKCKIYQLDLDTKVLVDFIKNANSEAATLIEDEELDFNKRLLEEFIK
eukprot:GAHX01003014.1.p1 GENE.GAHX01003014.1~~GAHX01003014.1.p1  ORF type:complete len:81 (+),score=22.79 GAHX01003014.1:23-265(+)